MNRQKDIDFCFYKNLEIGSYDIIYLILSESDYRILIESNADIEKSGKIVFFFFEKRPSFKDYIDIIGHTCGEDDINIFLNSDCYACDKTIEHVRRIKKDEMWCLQKYNIEDDALNVSFEDTPCSQDVWIFRGKPKEIKNIDFYFGLPGCDNRFAYECESAGYALLNPSLDIKFYHYHLSEIRHVENLSGSGRIPMPYRFIENTKII